MLQGSDIGLLLAKIIQTVWQQSPSCSLSGPPSEGMQNFMHFFQFYFDLPGLFYVAL